MPFFSFSLSFLTPHRRPLLFTIVFLFKFKNNRSPSLSPPVFISFALSWGVLFLSFSSFFYFLSLFPFHPRLHFLRPFQPRRPSLCNIINTAKFTSVYIHHAPRVQHSRRGEKPRAFSRARINRVTDCYWGPRSSFPYVSRPMMKVLCTIVSKHCRTIIICEYNWTMNRFVVPLQFKSLIYFKTKKNSERIDIPRHVINVYLC